MLAVVSIVVSLTVVAQLNYYQVSAQSNPDDEVCQSILAVTSTSDDCQPLGDCTGISCYSSTANSTVEIVVNKCTDPLVVNVTVYDGTTSGTPAVILSEQVTQAGDIASSEYKIDEFTRDSFTLTISVSYAGNGDTESIIPTVEIPLNASDCTCDAITFAGNNVEPPTGSSVNCTVNQACNGIECEYVTSIGPGGLSFFFEAEILPCNDPAGFEVVIRNAKQVAIEEFYFDKDGNVTVLTILPMRVTVDQRPPYSMTISGVLQFADALFQVIPRVQVILDRQNCLASPSTPTSTATPTMTPLQTISPEACKALKQIASQTNNNVGSARVTTCTVNSDCDTLDCNIFNQYLASFHLQPCLNTPAFHTIVSNNRMELFNGVIADKSEEIVLTSNNVKLTVTVKQKTMNISLQVDIDLGFNPFPIIPESDVSTDQCYCSDNTADCTTSSSSVNLVVVVVPIVVAIILLVIIVVVIIAVFVLIKKKGSGNNRTDDTATFKQMKEDD